MPPKPCAFCEIVADPKTASVVYEDELSLAFLDIRPLFRGHVLLVPKEHIVTVMDLPRDLIAPLFSTAQRLSSAVQHAMKSQGIFMAANNVVSQSVPHLHIHIVPRTKGDGLKGFFWPRSKYANEEEQEEVRALIAAAVSRL